MTQVAHADLAQHITQQTIPTANSTLVQTAIPTAGPVVLAYLNGEVTRQALFIAYLDDFKLMMLVTFAVLPLLFLMRKSQQSGGRPQMAMD
jgi:DHA2 family multidrug resistance protein